jgi:hypothetical protein
MTDPRIELDQLRRELKDTEPVLWPSYWDFAKGWLGVFGPPTIRRRASPIFIAQVFVLFHILCFAIGAGLILTSGSSAHELGIAMVVGFIFAFGSFVGQLFAIAYRRTNEIAQQITGSQKMNDLKQLAARREAIMRQIEQLEKLGEQGPQSLSLEDRYRRMGVSKADVSAGGPAFCP